MGEEKSCLIVETREFVLDAFGKTRQEAIGNIFGKFKKTVYTSVAGLIVHMEPDDVFIIEEKEKTSTQKFLGYFAPKEIRDVYVKIKIVAIVKYIPNKTEKT